MTEIPIGKATRIIPQPPPPDHPAWRTLIVTPADIRRATRLLVARDMDEALAPPEA